MRDEFIEAAGKQAGRMSISGSVGDDEQGKLAPVQEVEDGSWDVGVGAGIDSPSESGTDINARTKKSNRLSPTSRLLRHFDRSCITPDTKLARTCIGPDPYAPADIDTAGTPSPTPTAVHRPSLEEGTYGKAERAAMAADPPSPALTAVYIPHVRSRGRGGARTKADSVTGVDHESEGEGIRMGFENAVGGLLRGVPFEALAELLRGVDAGVLSGEGVQGAGHGQGMTLGGVRVGGVGGSGSGWGINRRDVEGVRWLVERGQELVLAAKAASPAAQEER